MINSLGNATEKSDTKYFAEQLEGFSYLLSPGGRARGNVVKHSEFWRNIFELLY